MVSHFWEGGAEAYEEVLREEDELAAAPLKARLQQARGWKARWRAWRLLGALRRRQAARRDEILRDLLF